MILVRRNVQSLLMVAVLGVLFASSRPVCADEFNYAVLAYPGSTLTIATGINNSGDIVGGLGEPFETGFLYQDGNFSLFPGIVDINNNRMILFNSPSGPAIFFNEMITPISAPGAVIAFNNKLSVLVSGGLQSGSTFYPINFPGSVSTTLRGINDLDEVVGSYVASNQGMLFTHGFLYSNGAYTTIDFPGAISSNAYAINNNGQIAGNYFISQKAIQGFIYENGDFETFNAFNALPSPDSATVPQGINDFGEITGYQLGNKTVSFVATPVPELGTLGLVGTGLMMITGSVRRRLH